MLSDKILVTSYVAYGPKMSIKLIGQPGLCDTLQVFTSDGKSIAVMSVSDYYNYCIEHDWLIDPPMQYDTDDIAAYQRLLARLKR